MLFQSFQICNTRTTGTKTCYYTYQDNHTCSHTTPAPGVWSWSSWLISSVCTKVTQYVLLLTNTNVSHVFTCVQERGPCSPLRLAALSVVDLNQHGNSVTFKSLHFKSVWDWTVHTPLTLITRAEPGDTSIIHPRAKLMTRGTRISKLLFPIRNNKKKKN